MALPALLCLFLEPWTTHVVIVHETVGWTGHFLISVDLIHSFSEHLGVYHDLISGFAISSLQYAKYCFKIFDE